MSAAASPRIRSAGRPPRRVRAALALAVALSGWGCGSCPPDWAETAGAEGGYLWAAASAGETFVDADPERLALTRAARRLADALGLDVERRLAVTRLDDRLVVEAVGPQGLLHDLDGLELVELRTCDGRTHARVRLARR